MLTHSAGQDRDPISDQLAMNQEKLENMFSSCQDLRLKTWKYGSNMQFSAISVCFGSLNFSSETYINATMEELNQVFEGSNHEMDPQKIIYFFENQGITKHTAKILDFFDQAVDIVLDGSVVIFFNSWNRAIAYTAPKIPSRAISEPSIESAIFGPHNSTIEDLNTNLGLIRSSLKTTKLKFCKLTIGKISQKEIFYGYLDGIVPEEVLKEYTKRLTCIQDIDILDVTYLEEWVGDSRYSPFPQVRYTERPDIAHKSLLEGKIITLVEGSPAIMIAPGLFADFFSVTDDYYQRILFSSLIRWLRILAFFLSFSLSSVYIALTTYHEESIPNILLLAMMDVREKVPFPTLFETFIMEFFFEIFREAINRLPKSLSSTVSIVGALVIGEAAIQSNIASPVTVIVVALAGISSFAVPYYNFGTALRVIRFPLMLLSGTLGGFGLMIGLYLVLLHLVNLKVLKQSYLKLFAPINLKVLLSQIVFRAPIKQLQQTKTKLYGGEGE